MAGRTISNNRRIYLCTYDVCEDKRRTELFELLKDYGEHVQFSVFLCSMTSMEVQCLAATVADIIHQQEDQLLVIDIGPDDVDWVTSLVCHGKTWSPSVRSQII